jgi:hypothetical protein
MPGTRPSVLRGLELLSIDPSSRPDETFEYHWLHIIEAMMSSAFFLQALKGKLSIATPLAQSNLCRAMRKFRPRTARSWAEVPLE